MVKSQIDSTLYIKGMPLLFSKGIFYDIFFKVLAFYKIILMKRMQVLTNKTSFEELIALCII